MFESVQRIPNTWIKDSIYFRETRSHVPAYRTSKFLCIYVCNDYLYANITCVINWPEKRRSVVLCRINKANRIYYLYNAYIYEHIVYAMYIYGYIISCYLMFFHIQDGHSIQFNYMCSNQGTYNPSSQHYLRMKINGYDYWSETHLNQD